MPSEAAASLLDGVFRANPAYEPVLFDRLPHGEREALRGMRADPDFYGILRPRNGAALGIKTICRDTALLVLTLDRPGPLPGFVRDDPEAAAQVAAMVLDGVLELRHGGAWLCGPAAHDAVRGGAAPPAADAGDAVGRLSRAALRHAQALEIDDPLVLSARLYHFNRHPASPVWRRRLPHAEAVAAFLGASRVGGGWDAVQRTGSPWLAWVPRRRTDAAEPPAHKLYLSPRAEALPGVFLRAAEILGDAGAAALKVGADLPGILRPDKVVAHFHDAATLLDAAARLRDALGGCPAQGVPFTAGLTADGLLSRGVDPPREATVAWRDRESWRLWVTNRLAVALVRARQARPPGLEPWEFAVQRIQLEGVDPETWSPAGTGRSAAPGGTA